MVTDRGEIPSRGTSTIADLNEDGKPDIIFGGEKGVQIYWGDGSRNFSENRQSIVPDTAGISSVEVADLNRDRHLDLILTRGIDKGSRLTTGFVYWGNSQNKYVSKGRTEFACC